MILALTVGCDGNSYSILPVANHRTFIRSESSTMDTGLVSLAIHSDKALIRANSSSLVVFRLKNLQVWLAAQWICFAVVHSSCLPVVNGCLLWRWYLNEEHDQWYLSLALQTEQIASSPSMTKLPPRTVLTLVAIASSRHGISISSAVFRPQWDFDEEANVCRKSISSALV